MSELHDLVKRQFGLNAERYVQSYDHSKGESLDRMVEAVNAQPDWRALDIATGGGHTALAFADFTESVIATDLTEPMLRAARQLAAARGATAIRFTAADADALPFKDASFGAITCRIAAHHFAELLPVLRQVARVLRPGGSFLVEDFLGHDDAELAAFMTDVERRRDPSHVRAFRQIEWTAFLRAAGLTVIDEAVVSKVRDWDDWTARAQMSSIAKRDLDRVVLAAPARCRDAFDFTVEAGQIRSFTTRLLLLRADRD